VLRKLLLLILSGVASKNTAAYGDILAKHLNTNWRYQFYINQNSKNQGDFMGTKIGKEKIKREPGYLYYLGKDGFVWAAPMKNNKGGKKKKVGTEKIAREKGFLYYLGKDGFVGKAKMKNA
jgi:hypothetical protein